MKRACLVFLIFLLSLASVYACTCTQESIEEKFAKADLVFYGRVMSVRDTRFSELDPFSTFGFDVFTVWKGYETSVEVNTRVSELACGYPFKIGQDYLVFVSSKATEMQTDFCAGNKPIEEASQELRFLGAGTIVKEPPKEELSFEQRYRKEIIMSALAILLLTLLGIWIKVKMEKRKKSKGFRLEA